MGIHMESESLANQHIKRTLRLGCIAIPLVIIIACVVSQIQHLYPPKNVFLVDKNEPYDVALAFAYSLPYNKINEMKSYVAQEKWEFLDNWTKIHSPISKKCRYPWDPDFHGAMMVGGNDVGGSSSVSLFYTYDCPNYSYWFNFSGLELKLLDGKWQIVDWEEICEERDGVRRCFK